MIADNTHKREALEELIRSDGWRYFCDYVRREWQGSGYQRHLTVAFGTGDQLAPRLTHGIAQELVKVLMWPEQTVRDLKGVVE